MTYDLFISYSSKDLDLVYAIDRALRNSALIPFVSHTQLQPGIGLDTKYKDAIINSSYFLVLYTQDAADSKLVNQEIGMAFDRNKHIIPIVEVGVKPTGILEGKEYILFDRAKPWEMMQKLYSYANHLRQELDDRARLKRSLIFGAIGLGLLYFLTRDNER